MVSLVNTRGSRWPIGRRRARRGSFVSGDCNDTSVVGCRFIIIATLDTGYLPFKLV